MTEVTGQGHPISVDLLTGPAGVPRAQAMARRQQFRTQLP